MFNLTPWRRKPTNEVTEFRKEMDNLVDRFFGGSFFPAAEFLNGGKWFPTVDIREGKKEITVQAEIPGVEAKDIDVSVDGRMLTIKGEKKQEKEEKDENYHRVERTYGYYNRTIELPAEVDASEVDATYKKGILKVVLKKTKESETKKIEVKKE